MINKIRTIFIVLTSILIFSTLTGCRFKSRSSKDVPPHLRILYIDSPNPYDLLTVQLRRTFQALKVCLTRTRESAPIILRIININWKPCIPSILYSSTITPYTYLLSVNFDLETRSGHILMGPRNLILRRQLIQNTNQIYTPNATRLMKREMTRIMISLIYKEFVAHKEYK